MWFYVVVVDCVLFVDVLFFRDFVTLVMLCNVLVRGLIINWILI